MTIVASDERLELAYDAASLALEKQDGTLGSLRNRATAALSTAALVTSFSSGLGLINTDPKNGVLFPDWAAFAMLAIMVLIGGLATFVLWSISNWHYCPDAADILAKTDSGSTLDQVRREVTDAMLAGRTSNAARLVHRQWSYRLSALLLIAQVAVLVAAVVTR